MPSVHLLFVHPQQPWLMLPRCCCFCCRQSDPNRNKHSRQGYFKEKYVLVRLQLPLVFMDCGLAWIGFGCVWEYHITSPPLRLPPLPLVAPFHRLSFCSSRSVPFFLLSRISNSFSNRSNSHLISLRSFIPLNSNSFLRLFAYLAPPLLFLSSSLPHILHEFSFFLTPSSVCTQYIQLVSLCVLHIDMLSLCSLPKRHMLLHTHTCPA